MCLCSVLIYSACVGEIKLYKLNFTSNFTCKIFVSFKVTEQDRVNGQNCYGGRTKCFVGKENNLDSLLL